MLYAQNKHSQPKKMMGSIVKFNQTPHIWIRLNDFLNCHSWTKATPKNLTTKIGAKILIKPIFVCNVAKVN